MNRFSRLWRHLLATAAAGRRAFPQQVLDTIRDRIAEGERRHRAEVRMVVEASLTLWQVVQGVTARQRAAELFLEHGIWDTEENTGVLIYVLLADHKVEILADRAVACAVKPDEWQAICRTMTSAFHVGDYRRGALDGLDRLNTLLAERFPDDDPQPNQLSNEPVIL